MLKLTAAPDRGEALASALGSVPARGSDAVPFLRIVGPIVDESLSPDVDVALRRLREARNTSGALHVTSFVAPDPSLPPTPRVPDPVLKLSARVDGVILGIALQLGQPISYPAEKGGALVQNVFPVSSETTAPSNEGSVSALGLHTELVFSRQYPERPLDLDSPDFLVLSCLRSDPQSEAATVVVDARDVCRHLSAKHRGVLREPRFELQAPYSFTRDDDGSRPWVGPVGLIKGDDTDPQLAMDLACGTRALDGEAAEALAALRITVDRDDLRSQLRLCAGDILVIDNRRCLHGRSSFFPRYDGRDRWIQRVYVRRATAAEP